MPGRLGVLWGRVVAAMLLMTGSFAPLACGSILGIDDGVPALDGSTGGDAQDSSYDVTPDGHSTDGGRDGGGGDADAAPCKDPTYCDMHCGNGSDMCGQTQMCTNNCSGTEACSDASNQCVCQELTGFCTGRCGPWKDNCDAGVTCMTPCDAGCADTGYCAGCTPDPNACGSAVCGSAFNGCATVTCGPNGGNCANLGLCDAGECCTPTPPSVACMGYCNGITRSDGCWGTYACDNLNYCLGGQVCNVNTCCTPYLDPCNGNCTGFASDGCGNTVVCGPAECQGNAVCYMGGCCTPNPQSCMGVPCNGTGNCGQTCTLNCNDGGPKDGGVMEAGCEEAGAPCSGSFMCCSGFCSNPNAMCSDTPCSNDAGTSCIIDTDCCYPKTCHFFDGGQGFCG